MKTGSKVHDSRFPNNLSPQNSRAHAHTHTPFTVRHMANPLMSDTQVWKINMDSLITQRNGQNKITTMESGGMMKYSTHHILGNIAPCLFCYKYASMPLHTQDCSQDFWLSPSSLFVFVFLSLSENVSSCRTSTELPRLQLPSFSPGLARSDAIWLPICASMHQRPCTISFNLES